MHYVVDAVFTLVIAIQKLIEEKCPKASLSNAKPVCAEFFPFDGTKLLSILRNVSFRNGRPCTRVDHPEDSIHSSTRLDLSQRSIKFTSKGDGIGTYDIFQYQIINLPDTLDYRTIGEFSDSDLNSEK